MYIDLTQATAFMLILLRMTGMLIPNPILGRRNVPALTNLGLALVLTVMLFPTMIYPPFRNPSAFTLLLMAVRELGVGLTAGLITRLFLSVLIVAGEVMDMQLGTGMAKNFDPATNSSVSLVSSWLTTMFLLTFFITNNHLTFIRLTVQTFQFAPIGALTFNPVAFYYIPQLFTTVLILAMKLCLPLVVVEIIVTVSVGLIMRIIPQINIFVLNIQFKILIGLFTLLVLVPPIIGALENIITLCMERIQDVWALF